MYSDSLDDSEGSTTNRWNIAGYMLPIAIATNAHKPTETTGSTQPLLHMLMMRRIAAASEINMRSLMWKLLSLY